MSINIDPNAAHAVYAPSSAHRWTVCTASAEAIARLPEQEEGEAAKKGTEAHSELERCLANADAIVDPDHESAYGIALFVDFIRQLPPGRLWVEHRVALTEQIWGRLDCGHWDEANATVTVADYKDGFVDVDVVENEQLRVYAAALIQQHKLPARWVRYVIVQPNSIAPGPRVKQFLEPVETLTAFAMRAAAVPAGPKAFKAGEHCRYCVLFGRCEATRDLLVHLAVLMQHTPDEVRPEQAATIMALKKPIEDWFKTFDKSLTKAALTGAVPPGMKLVTTVKHRAWKDEAAARAMVVELAGVDALDSPTPSQCEKIGIAAERIDALADRPDGAPALAFESDKRKPWAPKSAAEMFKGVTG